MDRFELLDFSNEILVNIFRSLNDIDLMTTARVCQRFRKIAAETVKTKYNGDSLDKHYKVNVHIEEGDIHWLCSDFLQTFGDQITALHLNVEQQSKTRKLLQLINTHCRFVNRLVVRSRAPFPITKLIRKMQNLSNLTLDSSPVCAACTDFEWAESYYPRLERVCFKHVDNIDMHTFTRFLIINKQLKHVQVIKCKQLTLVGIQKLENHLSGLKSLEYMCIDNELKDECSDMKMDALESLKISSDYTSATKILSAFGRGGRMIRELDVSCEGDISNHETQHAFLHSMPLFDKLTSLKLDGFPVQKSLIQIFILNLPHLNSLHLNAVKLNEVTTHTVLKVFTKCQKLKELTLKNERQSFEEKVHFDSEFHGEFVQIVQKRGGNVKLNLVDMHNNLLITEEKIAKDGILLYWTGCEASLSRSDVHLFDLNEKVLHNIYDHLDESAQRALYETCTKMKTALQERIRSQWFTVSDEKTAKDLFSRFGEHITKLKIDMKTNNRQQMTETWKIISERGSKQITEMSMNNVQVNATSRQPVDFPHLSKLKVKAIVSSSSSVFPPMECPNLDQLELDDDDIISLSHRVSQLGISLNSLTKIRLNDLNRNIEKILSFLDDKTCDRILEFTIENDDWENEISVNYVNVAMRFRNLVTLNFVHGAIDKTHFQELFERCTKLKYLTLRTDETYDLLDWEDMLECIKENCKEMEVIRLYQSGDDYFKEHVVSEIVRILPNIELKTIFYDWESKTYRVENYSKLHYQNTQKPY